MVKMKPVLEKIAEEYIAAEDYVAALELLDRYIKDDESVAQAYFFRGGCHMKLRRFPPAIEDFRAAIELDDRMHEARLLLGICMNVSGDKDWETEIETALAACPDLKDEYERIMDATAYDHTEYLRRYAMEWAGSGVIGRLP